MKLDKCLLKVGGYLLGRLQTGRIEEASGNPQSFTYEFIDCGSEHLRQTNLRQMGILLQVGVPIDFLNLELFFRQLVIYKMQIHHHCQV